MNQRCKVKEYLGNNKALYVCPKGHEWEDTVIPTHIRKRKRPGKITEQMSSSMARWWKNGVYMECPKCPH